MKYNRVKMQTTLKAIAKIQEIKEKRAEQFYKNRMVVKKPNELREAMRDLKQNINLIEAPTSLRSKTPIPIRIGAQPQKNVNTAGGKAKKNGDDDAMEY
jgi:large subunit ribosomal protein L24e